MTVAGPAADPRPAPAGDLLAVLDSVWSALEAAVRDSAAPLRTPVVVGLAAGGIDGRIMVMRGCDRVAAQLVFHTDTRSPKALALATDPRVTIVGYDAAQLLQLRLHGRARLETAGAGVDAAWDATSPTARRNYATDLPPGNRLAAAGDGLPDVLCASTARQHFARLVVDVGLVDWLSLDPAGHRRARF
ncbi:MAG: pyridoxamine 5'-phosphate oxidase family protein, partial [Polymorphobacter sp.]